MSTVVIQERLRVPAEVVDLDSFCRWACSEEIPEGVRVSYLDGEVWVDMSPEQLYSHNQVKAEFTAVLRPLVKAQRLGLFCPDGMLFRNDEANLSTEPDGLFVFTKALRSGQVTVERGREGYDIMRGTPDMVLEVLSNSSVRKDTVMLNRLYSEAGITEYWLVDAREEPVQFEILRHTPNGYVAVPKRAGWQKSQVFGKSFRLSVETDDMGEPEFTLEVR